jgi:hypothetical protein
MNTYIVIIIVVILGGLGITIWGWRSQASSRKARQWPCVEGIIEQSQPGSEQSDLLPHIQYTFQVGEKSYRQTFQFPSGTHPLPEFTRSYLDKYPVGKNVQIYYDPQNPQRSTLEPGTQGDWLVLALGILTVIGGVAALIVSL